MASRLRLGVVGSHNLFVSSLTSISPITGATLAITGDSTFGGDVFINNNLDVAGDVVISGTLDVTGDATFNNVLINNVLTILGDIESSANINTTGNVSADSVTVTGAVVASSVSVTGEVSAGTVAANSIAASGAVTSGSVTTSGAVTAGSVTTAGAINANTVTTTGAITTAGFVIAEGIISPTYSFGGQPETFNVPLNNGGPGLTTGSVSPSTLRNYFCFVNIVGSGLTLAPGELTRVVITHNSITSAANIFASAELQSAAGVADELGLSAFVIDISPNEYTVLLRNYNAVAIDGVGTQNRVLVRVTIFQ